MPDEELLRLLVSQHHQRTQSTVAKDILDNWDTAREKFVKVFPNEYRRALNELAHEGRDQREAA
jgi:glutamate synthase (NADPH/NADH) large chain